MGSQVNEKMRDRKTSFFFLYKAYYAKHRGFLLRKHCKEGATVVTQFLTHAFDIFSKNPKIEKKQRKSKKYVFLIYFRHFSIFNIV